MRLAPRHVPRALLVAAAPVLLACGGSDAGSADSAFSRDLALAGADTAAQPGLQDVATPPELPRDTTPLTRTPGPAPRPAPATPTSTTPSPAPATVEPGAAESPAGNVTSAGDAGGGSVGTVPGGSTLQLSAGQRVCTSTSRVGDRFTATVREAVEGTNGARIPAGATLVLEATQMRRSNNVRERAVIGFTVVSLIVNGVTYPVVAEVTQVQVEEARSAGEGSGMKKVATGAAIGAIVGQIMGRDTRSTVTGAAAGAVLGAGAAIVTANFDGCVPGGGRVDVRITEPLQVRVAAE